MKRADTPYFLEARRKAKSRAKWKVLEKALFNPAISDSEFRFAAALLIRFHNTRFNKCCPTDATLGHSLGRSDRTAGTHTRALNKKGFCTKTRTNGAPRYCFPGLEDRKNSSDLRSETSRQKIGNIASEDRKAAFRTEPLFNQVVEPDGEASPSPCEGRASASLETQNKPNGSALAEPHLLSEEERRKQADRVTGGKWRRA